VLTRRTRLLIVIKARKPDSLNCPLQIQGLRRVRAQIQKRTGRPSCFPNKFKLIINPPSWACPCPSNQGKDKVLLILKPSSKTLLTIPLSEYLFNSQLMQFHSLTRSIVFVHGLRGHRTGTWTKGSICWPRDLLPKEEEFSNVRILSFGYDSRVINPSGHGSLESLLDNSMSLLKDLYQTRGQDAVSSV
jgi:hypothetical protein